MDKFNEILEELYKAKNFGYEKLNNGTELIGFVPHVAPDAKFHLVFNPLNSEEIKNLETEIGIKFPKEFSEFLLYANGLSVYSNSFTFCKTRHALLPPNEKPLFRTKSTLCFLQTLGTQSILQSGSGVS